MTETREIRKFGLFVGVLFSGLTVFGIWRGGAGLAAAGAIMAAFGVGCALWPSVFRPAHAAFQTVAVWIGSMMTGVILTVFYYLVMAPYALILRFCAKPLMPLRGDADAQTYWTARREPAQPRERFIKRY